MTTGEALHEALEPRLAARPASEWAQLLTEARVPAGVVNDIARGVCARADARARADGVDPREDGSEVVLTRNPMTLSRTPADLPSAPPTLP